MCSASTTCRRQPDAALRNATQIPVNDPLDAGPAMAAVTEISASGDSPCPMSRPTRSAADVDARPSHRGGSLKRGDGLFERRRDGAGKDKQTAHDDRYEVADDVYGGGYKLWEGSWEDDAALRDRARGIFRIPPRCIASTMEGNNYRLTPFI